MGLCQGKDKELDLDKEPNKEEQFGLKKPQKVEKKEQNEQLEIPIGLNKTGKISKSEIKGEQERVDNFISSEVQQLKELEITKSDSLKVQEIKNEESGKKESLKIEEIKPEVPTKKKSSNIEEKPIKKDSFKTEEIKQKAPPKKKSSNIEEKAVKKDSLKTEEKKPEVSTKKKSSNISLSSPNIKFYGQFGSHKTKVICAFADVIGLNYEFVNTEKKELKKNCIFTDDCYIQVQEKIIQGTGAILRYLAKQQEGYGNSSMIEQAQLDQFLEFVIHDFGSVVNQLNKHQFGIEIVTQSVYYKNIENLKESCQYLNNALENKTYIIGKKLTAADILIAAASTYIFRILVSEKLRNTFPNLVKHHQKICQEKGFSKWFGSPVYCKQSFQKTFKN